MAPPAAPAYRTLPSDVRPSSVQIELEPDLQLFTFKGKVETTLCVLKSDVASITCHANKLEFDHAYVKLPSDDAAAKVICTAIKPDAEAQTVTFEFAAPFADGAEIVLCVEYHGVLDDSMAGFYRSSYKDAQGNTQWMAVTQFEATDARKCLPCWDEPAAKVAFEATLLVDPALTAISNTKVVSSTDTPAGKKRVQFAPTPVMSSYLLAFVVGNFTFVERTTLDGRVRARVYARPGTEAQLGFALDTTCKCLEFFETFFGVPYALDKCDMLAIPDFACGAMENWGCITYRETRLLIPPETPLDVKISTSRTICHELAHMWFGNLVTMDWWTQLWLNEGFARYCEHLAVDSIYPEFQIWNQFVEQVRAAALALDAMESSHPIEVEVGARDDIDSIFDAISYAKGASFLRMLSEYVGPEQFRAGVSAYLKKHEFSNAVSGDLWSSLSDVAGAALSPDVGEFAKTWTLETGFPVVHVAEKTAAAASDGVIELELRQERFFARPGNQLRKQDATVWHVPIVVAQVAAGADGSSAVLHTAATTLLSGKDAVVSCTLAEQTSGDAAALFFNPGQITVTRVNLSPALLRRLAAPIRAGALSVVDRLGVLDDAFACAFAGYSDMFEFLAFVDAAFTEERDHFVISKLSECIGALVRLHSDESYAEPLGQWAAALFKPLYYATGGWDQPAADPKCADPRTRASVLARLKKDAEVQEAGVKLFDACGGKAEQFLALPPDTRAGIFAAGVRSGSTERLEQLLEFIPTVDNAVVVRELLSTIGVTPSREEKRRVLTWGVDGGARDQDLYVVFSSVAGSGQDGRDVAWEVLTERWDQLVERYSRGTATLLSHKVTVSAAGNSDRKHIDKVREFFATRTTKALGRALAKTLESIEINASRLDAQKERVAAWAESVAI